MILKKQSNQPGKDNVEANSFRQAAGFSFDFIKGEPSIYLVCTEEGTLHRCSRSYSEQYLESYAGHSGS